MALHGSEEVSHDLQLQSLWRVPTAALWRVESPCGESLSRWLTV